MEHDRRKRILSRKGFYNVHYTGVKNSLFKDLHHRILELTWPRFLLLACVTFLGSNGLFGWLYTLGGDCIQNARPGSLWDAFVFSIQTSSTIGYGFLAPKTVYADYLVIVESLLSLLFTALLTGLTFAKFSRPTARVLFSNYAVIQKLYGKPTLIFRVGNSRANQIVDATINVVLTRRETTSEGIVMRRLYDLKLARNRSPVFALTWTVIHPIEPDSPLHNQTMESLIEQDVEIIISLTGLDDTFKQSIHSMHSYSHRDLRYGHRLVDLLSHTDDGSPLIDFTKFHLVIPE